MSTAQNSRENFAVNAHPKWLKSGPEAKALAGKELHALTGKAKEAQVAAEHTLDMSEWRWRCTLLEAEHVYSTGAAILGTSPLHVGDKDMPYVKKWKANLREIDWHKKGFVTAFLRDVIFWSSQSTSGRYNPALGRFERWGVKSVEGWRDQAEHSVSRRDFFRVKDRLIEMGLIEAHSHYQYMKYVLAGPLPDDAHDVGFYTALWIKPTEELSRIVFEPGYWETVKAKYAYVKVKGKPRGVHAAKSKPASEIPKIGTSLSAL